MVYLLVSFVSSLHARCIYNATDFLPVKVEVVLPPTPAPVLQMGPLRLELRIAIGKDTPELPPQQMASPIPKAMF